MKTPFLYLLFLIFLQSSGGRCRSQQGSQGSSSFTFPSDDEFRPSRLISSYAHQDQQRQPSVNSFNVTVAYPQGESQQQDAEGEGTFSHPVVEAEGRTFGASGGWGGVENTFCQKLQGYNSGCCSLGYSNCCGGNNFHSRPHVGGWGGFYTQPQRYPVQHRPPIRPVLPVVPLPRPILYQRPVHHHGSGWGNSGEKPGSCKSSSFSFLNKLNLFSKAKDIFGKVEPHHGHGSKGWGWEPPSHSGGWHFHRRSDSFLPLTKRQATEGHTSDNANVFVIGGRGNKETSGDNALFHRASSNKSPSSFYYDQSFSSEDNSKAGTSWGRHEASPPSSPFIGRSYASPYNNYNSFNEYPRTVGIGSLSGRVLGGWGGWGGGHTHRHHCRLDYECPGNEKCCEGVCSAPSFFG